MGSSPSSPRDRRGSAGYQHASSTAYGGQQSSAGFGSPSYGQQRNPALQHQASLRFKTIRDNFQTLTQVQDALRRNGLESSQLILGFDFTKSNEWTGKHSFGNRSLHDVSGTPNPYETAASIIGRSLAPFDDDNLIPCYGFGDTSTHDTGVFSFFKDDQPAHGLQEVVWRYRQIVPYVALSGPTSFAPLIHQAMRATIASGMQYHICIIIADGQVTRSVDMPPGQLGPQEQATVNAIVAASNLPLSIIMVGVGDGPFDLMQEFDDALPSRKFDNFQFVNFTEVAAQTAHAPPAQREALFALRALMEIPEQYKEIVRAGMLGAPVPHVLSGSFAPPPNSPPPSVLAADSRLSQTGGPAGSPGSFGGANGVPGGYSTAAVGNPMASAPTQVGGRDIDPQYICPITQEVMSEPHIAADGFCYEKTAIQQWLNQHDTSPMSNERLPHKNLIPNHALRSAIQDWRVQNPRM